MTQTGRPRPLPRLIIHAGLGKSGSSAIQKYCREHARDLRAERAAYLGMYLDRGPAAADDFPDAASFDRALTALDPTALQDRLVAIITAKIAAQPGVRTFIWSQIALATHAALLGPVLARLDSVCEPHVILYFRHQADWLVSAYAQWGVKHKTYEGAIRSFEEFRPLAAAHGSDYRAVIDSWRDAIDPARLHLRSYDRCADVVADFLSVAELGPVITGDAGTRHYETPDAAVLALFRLLQGQSDDVAPPGPLWRAVTANGVADRRYRSVDPALGLPSGAAWTAFASSFDAENAALEHDFGLSLGPARKEPAPDPVIPAPAALIPPLLDLIVALDRRVGALERKLARRDNGEA